MKAIGAGAGRHTAGSWTGHVGKMTWPSCSLETGTSARPARPRRGEILRAHEDGAYLSILGRNSPAMLALVEECIHRYNHKLIKQSLVG